MFGVSLPKGVHDEASDPTATVGDTPEPSEVATADLYGRAVAAADELPVECCLVKPGGPDPRGPVGGVKVAPDSHAL